MRQQDEMIFGHTAREWQALDWEQWNYVMRWGHEAGSTAINEVRDEALRTRFYIVAWAVEWERQWERMQQQAQQQAQGTQG